MMAAGKQGSEAEWCLVLTAVLCIPPKPGREEGCEVWIQQFFFSILQQSKRPCLGLGTVALLAWILHPQPASVSLLASESIPQNGKLGLGPHPLD